jgi:DinB superfamily
MTIKDRDFLLRRLDDTRSKIEELLLKTDRKKEIYPGWSIKELLAHMTGWDDATIDSLRAHVIGRPPSVATIHSLDTYNAGTVSSRNNLNYDQILKEWRLTRQVLRTLIEQMPEEKFFEPLSVPWGGKATVTYLVDMFREHEEEHANDLKEWIKHPEKPLEKAGN